KLLGLRGGGAGPPWGRRRRAPRPPAHRTLPSLASGRLRSGSGAEGLRDGSATFLACSSANVRSAVCLRAALRATVPPATGAGSRGGAGGPRGRVPGAGRVPPPAERPQAQPQPPESEAPVGLGAPTTADTPTVTVDTDVLRATITTMGARLKSLELKNFRQTVARDS